MIETYSKGVAAGTNQPINLNNVKLLKGSSVVKQGSSSLLFNKCGIYRVDVKASAVAGEVGNIVMQLQKNGALDPAAISTATAANTTDYIPMGFTTFVQVPRNNTECPCSESTVVDVINTGVDATFDIDVTVSKI